VELLVEEKLVLVTTPPGVRGDAPPYVHVDWGPEFALWKGPGRADRSEPVLHVGLGPLGLGYILAAGGSGYFRMGAVRPHLENGLLILVPGAPEFVYPAYVVHAETTDPKVVRLALDGLRYAAVTEQAEIMGDSALGRGPALLG
jgi:DNA-binding transcriptional LysR family regulator